MDESRVRPMRVLFLGPDDSPVRSYLQSVEEHVVSTLDRIDAGFVRSRQFDFLVSYGYRHIVRPDVLELFSGNAVNLHISLLPWNRGADPNLWSFVEDTPKGVSIHVMDEGVDTGDLLVQREIVFAEGETLQSSYLKLRAEIEQLFRQYWPKIRDGRCRPYAQGAGGSFHRTSDRKVLEHLLTEGWGTPVAALVRTGDTWR